MMKVLVDTNVVLDAIGRREPFHIDAERIFRLAGAKRINACLTANSVTDIHYIARQRLDEGSVREALRSLFVLFTIVEVRGRDCEMALDLPLPDYEDALMVVCGRKAGVEFIVTRDQEFLRQTPEAILPISPKDFLEKIES